MIRLDRGIQGFRLTVPHHESYTVERDRLLWLVDQKQLVSGSATDLPPRVILLSRVDEADLSDASVAEQFRDHYSRRLFHACVHLELESRFANHDIWQSRADERRRQIGEVEFAEIGSVLVKDDHLFPSCGDFETYVEFTAVYLELKYFAAHELACYFPAVRDWQEIDRLVSQDVDHQRLFRRFQIPDDVAPASPGLESGYSANTPSLDGVPLNAATFRRCRRKPIGQPRLAIVLRPFWCALRA